MNSRYVYDYYVRRGLPPHVAKAFTGNLYVESAGFDPRVIAGQRTGDSGTAFGAAQWRGARFRNLKKFAAQAGRDWRDLDVQLDFTLEEVNPKSPYKDAIAAGRWNDIVGSRTTEEATSKIMRYYERAHPDHGHLSRRIVAANNTDRGAPSQSLPAQTSIVPQPRPENSQVQVASATPFLPSDDRPKGMAALAPNGLRFRDPAQDHLHPDLKAALAGTSAEFGRDLKINSGYRDPAYNRKVGGAKSSYHTRGQAADVDLSGLSPVERQKFVAEMTQRGAGGFITYDGNDSIHVDMRPRPDGRNPHFMHNRSQANMARAPEWFQQAEAAGGTVLPQTAPLPFSPEQVQFGPPMPPEPEQFGPPMPPVQTPIIPAQEGAPMVAQAWSPPAAPAAPSPEQMFPPAPEAPVQNPGQAPNATGISALLAGLTRAMRSDKAFAGLAEQQQAMQQQAAQRQQQAELSATLAEMPTAIMAPEITTHRTAVSPFAPGAPVGAQEILASLFGRPSTRQV